MKLILTRWKFPLSTQCWSRGVVSTVATRKYCVHSFPCSFPSVNVLNTISLSWWFCQIICMAFVSLVVVQQLFVYPESHSRSILVICLQSSLLWAHFLFVNEQFLSEVTVCCNCALSSKGCALGVLKQELFSWWDRIRVVLLLILRLSYFFLLLLHITLCFFSSSSLHWYCILKLHTPFWCRWITC